MGLKNGVLTAQFTKIAADGNGDLQKVLETGSMSHIALCTHANINKWAKCKPIRHTTMANITPAQRVGMPVDQANGIIYGLKMGSYATIRDLINLTDWFDYVGKPTGGQYPYRALDFDGYYPKAVPNLSVASATNATEKKSEIWASIVFDPNNQYGVDYAMLASGGSSSDAPTTIGTWYPYVVVANAQKTWFYARALHHYSPRQILPLYYSGHFDPAYIFDLTGIPELDNATSNVECLMSFFLMPNHDSDYDTWVEVEADTGYGNVYPIPNGLNMPLTVSPGTIVPAGVVMSYNPNVNQLEIIFGIAKSATYAIDLQATFQINNGAYTWGSAVLLIAAGSITTAMQYLKYSDYLIIEGDTVSIDWIIQTRRNGSTQWATANSGSFTFTA